MALQIPSLALLSGLTIFFTYFTPSTTATPKWPGDTVAEKIRLLEAVSPSDTVGKLKEYCEQQYKKNEKEWKEAQKRNKKLFYKLLSIFGFKGNFYKKMENELYAEYASQISSKYINPFKDCQRDCIHFESKWTKTKLRLEELQNVVEKSMPGANAHNELNKPDKLLTKLDQTKMALAKLKQLDVAPSKLDNNAEMTVGAFDQALRGLGKPDQKEMASKNLQKMSKWETTPLNTPSITPRKFDHQLSSSWENTAPSSPMAPHDEETPLFSTQKTDSARFSSMAWLSPPREDMTNKDDIPVSSNSPASLSSPMALSRLISWPDPDNSQENSQHNNVMALTTMDKADIVLEKLEYAINNKLEAFHKLIEWNECFKSVFAIPIEVVEQLEELSNFNLQQLMTDANKKAENGLEAVNTSSSPLSDTLRNGTNA